MRERVAELERIAFAADWTAPAKWRLTLTQTRVMGLLVRREQATQAQLAHAIWSMRPEREFPSRECVQTHICGLRAKLTPFGVVILTLWGHSYALEPLQRVRLRDGWRAR